MEKKFMEAAINEGRNGIKSGDGGPFGAVVVLNGEIIGSAHNEVVSGNDPTAHAEVLAIRRASAKLKRFDLSACELYTSCEPCPMCYSAVNWAGIKKVYYGCTRNDAADIGFDDKLIYDLIQGKNTNDGPEMVNCYRDESLAIFEMWYKKEDKIQY